MYEDPFSNHQETSKKEDFASAWFDEITLTKQEVAIIKNSIRLQTIPNNSDYRPIDIVVKESAPVILKNYPSIFIENEIDIYNAEESLRQVYRDDKNFKESVRLFNYWLRHILFLIEQSAKDKRNRTVDLEHAINNLKDILKGSLA